MFVNREGPYAHPVVMCFTCIKQNKLGENYKEEYKLCRERNPMTRMNVDAKYC
jgi:hypothetical protein